jgi:flagellar motor switch protein FliN/FliY
MADMLSQDEINALLNASGDEDSDGSADTGLDSGSANETQQTETQTQKTASTAASSQPKQSQPAQSAVSQAAQVSNQSQIPTGDIKFLNDVPLKFSVYLAKTKMPLKQALKLKKGSVVEMDKLNGEPADVYVNDQIFANGEIVVVEENFGIRLNKIMDIKEREALIKRIT